MFHLPSHQHLQYCRITRSKLVTNLIETHMGTLVLYCKGFWLEGAHTLLQGAQKPQSSKYVLLAFTCPPCIKNENLPSFCALLGCKSDSPSCNIVTIAMHYPWHGCTPVMLRCLHYVDRWFEKNKFVHVFKVLFSLISAWYSIHHCMVHHTLYL